MMFRPVDRATWIVTNRRGWKRLMYSAVASGTLTLAAMLWALHAGGIVATFCAVILGFCLGSQVCIGIFCRLMAMR